MAKQPDASIPARFTHVQRKEIAALLPSLADRLLLECKNQRTLSFSRDELDEMQNNAVSAWKEATTCS